MISRHGQLVNDKVDGISCFFENGSRVQASSRQVLSSRGVPLPSHLGSVTLLGIVVS